VLLYSPHRGEKNSIKTEKSRFNGLSIRVIRREGNLLFVGNRSLLCLLSKKRGEAGLKEGGKKLHNSDEKKGGERTLTLEKSTTLLPSEKVHTGRGGRK